MTEWVRCCPLHRHPRLAGSGGVGAAAQCIVGPDQGHPPAFWQTWRQSPDQSFDADNLGGAHWYHVSAVLRCCPITYLQTDSITDAHVSLSCVVKTHLTHGDLLVLLLIILSHSPAMACGECGPSPGALRQQSLLHHSGQQGHQWATYWDLQTHRVHNTGEKKKGESKYISFKLKVHFVKYDKDLESFLQNRCHVVVTLLLTLLIPAEGQGAKIRPVQCFHSNLILCFFRHRKIHTNYCLTL